MPRAADDAGSSGSRATRWLVVRHVATEGLGLLANVLRSRGIPHRYLDLNRGEPPPRDLKQVGGLIILGGPMAVYETERYPFLATEATLIERAITAGRPVLGICLGAQLIAHALGARVFAGERREVGFAPVALTEAGREDPLFAGVEPEPTVFHLHGDTFELPPDAVHLARSALYEQQAFRWGDCVLGMQFHVEFTEDIISRLLAEPAARDYVAGAGASPEAIVAEAPRHRQSLARLSETIFSNFFDRCGL